MEVVSRFLSFGFDIAYATNHAHPQNNSIRWLEISCGILLELFVLSVLIAYHQSERNWLENHREGADFEFSSNSCYRAIYQDWLASSMAQVSGCRARGWEFDSPLCHPVPGCSQNKGMANYFCVFSA